MSNKGNNKRVESLFVIGCGAAIFGLGCVIFILGVLGHNASMNYALGAVFAGCGTTFFALGVALRKKAVAPASTLA